MRIVTKASNLKELNKMRKCEGDEPIKYAGYYIHSMDYPHGKVRAYTYTSDIFQQAVFEIRFSADEDETIY